MLRLLMLVIALLAMGVGTGCQDDSQSKAEEMGFESGRRPAKSEQRAPPGPGGGESGFEKSREGEGVEPPPDDNP